jgi:hypothetical protein
MKNGYPGLERERRWTLFRLSKRLACALRVTKEDGANVQRSGPRVPRSLNEDSQLWGAVLPKEEFIIKDSLGTRPWRQSEKTASGSSESLFFPELKQSDLKKLEGSGQRDEVHGYGEAFLPAYLQMQFGFLWSISQRTP